MPSLAYRDVERKSYEQGELVRLAWRTGAPRLPLAITFFMTGLLWYAVLFPWSDKLAFPFYRGVMGLVGLSLAYLLLCTMFNASVVWIEGRTLYRAHGPLPTFGFGDRPLEIPILRVVAIGATPLGGVRLHLRDGTDERLLYPSSAMTVEIAKRVAKVLDLPLRDDLSGS